jgi:hypothetical protein
MGNDLYGTITWHGGCAVYHPKGATDGKQAEVRTLVARELMDEPQDLLEPFRFSRYETGELHPTSNSPFP